MAHHFSQEHTAIRKTALLALRRAAKKAPQLSRRTKTPFIVFKDGKIVDLNAKKEASGRKCP